LAVSIKESQLDNHVTTASLGYWHWQQAVMTEIVDSDKGSRRAAQLHQRASELMAAARRVSFPKIICGGW
jgi:hypothetical protein